MRGGERPEEKIPGDPVSEWPLLPKLSLRSLFLFLSLHEKKKMVHAFAFASTRTAWVPLAYTHSTASRQEQWLSLSVCVLRVLHWEEKRRGASSLASHVRLLHEGSLTNLPHFLSWSGSPPGNGVSFFGSITFGVVFRCNVLGFGFGGGEILAPGQFPLRQRWDF